MVEPRSMSAVNLEDAYRYNREAELKRMGKGVLWYQVRKGSGLTVTSSKDHMVAAIMGRRRRRSWRRRKV